MKRVGHVYPQIYDKDNIRRAILKAADKKKNHKYVKKVMNNTEYYVNKVHIMLKEKSLWSC